MHRYSVLEPFLENQNFFRLSISSPNALLKCFRITSILIIIFSALKTQHYQKEAPMHHYSVSELFLCKLQFLRLYFIVAAT